MFFILILILLIAIYFYGTRNHSYWKNKGVQYEKPVVLFGSNIKFFTEGVSFAERFTNFYKRYPNEKYVGFFQANDPMLLLRDPELIKHVMLTDFRHFHHRGLCPTLEATEPLLKNVFIVDGDGWKLTRQRLTPAFSSGKLKAMFPLIVDRAEKLLKITDDLAKTGDEVDVRDLMARFTTDFIGACGFGLDMDCLNDKSSDFRKLGKRIFSRNLRDIVIGVLKVTAPNLCKNLYVFSPEVTDTCLSLVQSIMLQRNYKPSGRNDFIDMMLELKQMGKIVGESLEKTKPDGSPDMVELEIDDELIVAQVFVFFAAGFETSSSTSSFLLHMLAYHPDIQERCQREIDEVLAKYGGSICYDAIREMKYLDMAFSESIRLLPPVGFLARKCTKQYTFPGTNLTIEEGTGIIIPVHALHADEKHFADPDQFIPERFLPDNSKHFERNAYLPFGIGPRSCIGERMGKMQSIAGVAIILSKFTVAPSKSSIRNPKIDPTSTVVTTVLGGLPLSLKLRK